MTTGKDDDSDFSSDEEERKPRGRPPSGFSFPGAPPGNGAASRPVTLEFVLSQGVRMDQTQFDNTFRGRNVTEEDFLTILKSQREDDNRGVGVDQGASAPPPAPRPSAAASAAVAQLLGKKVFVCGTSKEEVNGCVGKVRPSPCRDAPPPLKPLAPSPYEVSWVHNPLGWTPFVCSPWMINRRVEEELPPPSHPLLSYHNIYIYI